MNTHIHIHYTHVTRHHLFNLLNSNFMCLSMSTKTQLYLNHAISVYKKTKEKKKLGKNSKDREQGVNT